MSMFRSPLPLPKPPPSLPQKVSLSLLLRPSLYVFVSIVDLSIYLPQSFISQAEAAAEAKKDEKPKSPSFISKLLAKVSKPKSPKKEKKKDLEVS